MAGGVTHLRSFAFYIKVCFACAADVHPQFNGRRSSTAEALYGFKGFPLAGRAILVKVLVNVYGGWHLVAFRAIRFADTNKGAVMRLYFGDSF